LLDATIGESQFHQACLRSDPNQPFKAELLRDELRGHLVMSGTRASVSVLCRFRQRSPLITVGIVGAVISERDQRAIGACVEHLPQ
jgi:hypothetical protein